MNQQCGTVRVVKLRKFLGLASFLHKPALGVDAETLLENFFVTAVATVLTTRLYLRLTGYPRIETAEFYIPHVLFGGLVMLLALVILLAYLDHKAKVIASIMGGIGFGLFVDELGKFVTRDNDYFFQPAVALIYIIFVLLFFLIRLVVGGAPLSSEERFANVFEIAKQASITGIAPEERELALELLEEEREDENVARNLGDILLHMSLAHSRRPSLLTRSKGLIDRFYRYAVGRWWFTGGVVGFFTFYALTSLSTVLALVVWSWGLGLWLAGAVLSLVALFWSRQTRVRYLNLLASAAIVVVSVLLIWAILGGLERPPLSLADWARFLFPALAGLIVVIGFLLIPISRIRAYKTFRLSVLISIFFTQVLAFYEYQFLAMLGLLSNVVILLALRYMINHEELKYQGLRLEGGLPELP